MWACIEIACVLFLLWMQWWWHQEHLQDLRRALEHERRMRKIEEDRADKLSRALFDLPSPQPSNEKLKN